MKYHTQYICIYYLLCLFSIGNLPYLNSYVFYSIEYKFLSKISDCLKSAPRICAIHRENTKVLLRKFNAEYRKLTLMSGVDLV